MAEEEVTLPTPWGKLAGTLLVPAEEGPWPVALLIAGSGPTDRDGNTPLLPGPIDNLKRLAGALAARGIASLRYDKRGVGASQCAELREEQLRFEDLVADAEALGRWLQQDERFGELLLLGHSEGALIAALVAPAVAAHGVVSLAGAGERASDLMRRQIAHLMPQELALPARAALERLEAQQPVEDVPESLLLLFRPSVQPYLMSWFRHEPAEVLARLRQPVLLLQGTADVQVPVDQAERLARARPDARLKLVQGMDHLLSIGGDLDGGTALVADEVAAWARELPQQGPRVRPWA